ncbi:hypothetical protein [Marinivivus vitaminiproducens]|uniref:hypothetical protein n=1 Tax=Marinivivus vitaminiproducens TaxID=3035935 RepID=UPI00279FCDF1|nr:hypothetical protein P4R82_24955 [Geminicoccaceae bacterium SCSIO 64248]
MRIALWPGADNVLRFPLERRARPSLALLRMIGPDPRGLDLMAESFGLELPDDGLRERTERFTVERLRAMKLPAAPDQRRVVLDAVLAPLVETAVAACRAADAAARRATRAQGDLLDAQGTGPSGQDRLEAEGERLAIGAALRLIEAHRRTEQAEGAARAIDFARRGDPWRPFDLRAEAETLFFGATRP